MHAPDWTSPERLEYTKRLFDLLAQLVPEDCEGSVSTVPGSFKEFIATSEQVTQMRANLWRCVEHIAQRSDRAGKLLHLEMETYTWEVLPAQMKNRNVVDQLVSEYGWTLHQLAGHGFKPK